MKDNKARVLGKLLEKPEYHFHIRELARDTNLNPNTIIKTTDELKKEQIIVKKQHKNLVEIYCDFDSLQYKREKQLFNIKLVQNSDLLHYLIRFYNYPKAIILFGSFFRGEDLSNGDIDIAVVSTEKETPAEILKYEKKLKRNIHLSVFEYKDISDEFYNNLINGFVLHGYIKDERLSNIRERKKS